MDQVHLASLPFEIIEQILQSLVLDIKDVCNVGKTCVLFRQLVNSSNQIWKTKFQQKWPNLISHETYKSHTDTNWLEECRQRWMIGQATMQLISTLSAHHIKHDELSTSDFKQFEDLYFEAGHKLTLQFMIDELMLCIHDSSRFNNLTSKYYSEKTLIYLRQLDMTHKWVEFKNDPPSEQLLERGAVIIAQWSQPTEEINDQAIGSEMDAIAVKVQKQLELEYGAKHPALCVPSELRDHWCAHNIADNHYTPHISRQVINAVSTVLFKEMGFYGNSDLYYSHENSYINKVLQYRRGIPITLSILFESVTRRLGVKCEPVSFPGHFLLRWRDTYKENVPTQYFYIDVFNGGVFLGKESCPQFATTQGRCPMGDIFRFGPATALQVMERMGNNLEVAGRQRTTMNGRAARLRSALELLHLLNPSNLNCMLQLARFYMQYNMDVSVLRHSIQSGTHFDLRDLGQASYILKTLKEYDENYRKHLNDHDNALEVKKRAEGSEAVQFAVGMVMRHRQFNYTCVVVGWDPVCVATDEWITQMNVKSLSRQQYQPFYHVLVSDGTSRYAAEENLEVERERDCWVNHCDVGRYFDAFDGSQYRPNAELLLAYPEDPPIANCHRCQ